MGMDNLISKVMSTILKQSYSKAGGLPCLSKEGLWYPFLKEFTCLILKPIKEWHRMFNRHMTAYLQLFLLAIQRNRLLAILSTLLQKAKPI